MYGALLLQFAELCDKLTATPKKLEKRALIAEYLRGLSVDDAGRAALYLAGTPFAETDRRALNTGGSLLSRAVAEVSGADRTAMHAAYRRHGDLGAAAEDLLASRRDTPPELTLKNLEDSFDAIAAARAPAAKLPIILHLLRRAQPVEAKYILKLMLGGMRIGVKQSLVEEGIATAWNATPDAVRHAAMLAGSLPEVVAMAATNTLSAARMRLFHPLGVMLASPVASVDEAMKRFAEEVAAEEHAEPAADPPPLAKALIEDKYDGIRAQLHCGDPTQPRRVGLFSRSRQDLGETFPELIDAFAAMSEPAILDGEILAWNPVEARALPFTALQQRIGRKRVTAEMQKQIPVIFMAFDAVYLSGDLLHDLALAERRQRLEAFIAKHGGIARTSGSRGQAVLFSESEPQSDFPRLVLAPATHLRTAEQLDRAYDEARERGNEGVMVKALASTYQPGRRGLAWLKLKRGLATLDVVVTGVEFGHGKRAGVLSDYTFAVRDGDGLKNVGKAYSGLTDAEISELTRFFQQHTIEDFGGFRTVEPLKVLEVAFNNIMRSDRHKSGFALRFPRILSIRDDKPVEEIDTLTRVEEIYNAQPDKPIEQP
ncbi:MAG: ATP-dependent DNA ligase [Silvibacterium sp.]|nr:ATP-dependent DNA ligase [Silvibacterium sp.]